MHGKGRGAHAKCMHAVQTCRPTAAERPMCPVAAHPIPSSPERTSPLSFLPSGLLCQSPPSQHTPPSSPQAYFAYDAHKSGGVTNSHLRFGPEPIGSSYEIEQADYLAVHHASYIQK